MSMCIDPPGLLTALPLQPAVTVTPPEDFSPEVLQSHHHLQWERLYGMRGVPGCKRVQRSQEWTIVVECTTHERRSSQPFLKFVHLDSSVTEKTGVPSLQPLCA